MMGYNVEDHDCSNYTTDCSFDVINVSTANLDVFGYYSNCNFYKIGQQQYRNKTIKSNLNRIIDV